MKSCHLPINFDKKNLQIFLGPWRPLGTPLSVCVQNNAIESRIWLQTFQAQSVKYRIGFLHLYFSEFEMNSWERCGLKMMNWCKTKTQKLSTASFRLSDWDPILKSNSQNWNVTSLNYVSWRRQIVAKPGNSEYSSHPRDCLSSNLVFAQTFA